LIAGHTTNTVSIGPILTSIALVSLSEYIFYNLMVYFYQHNNLSLYLLFEVLYGLVFPFYAINYLGLGNFISNLNPVMVLSTIGLGGLISAPYLERYLPARGWIYTNGLNGVKNWSGNIYGDTINSNFTIFWFLGLIYYFPGIFGFSGIKINFPFLGSFYLGHALKIKIQMY
jgi:hypothetical protein